MPVMDNPEVPPAVHVQIEHDVETDFTARPIGAIKVTLTEGLVATFPGRAEVQIVKSAPIRDEGDPPDT